MPASHPPVLVPLTSLRFFAALAIVIYHLRGSFAYDTGNILFQAAITFFFVLSGFILAYNYKAFPTGLSVLRYYIARVARIWPLHLATAAYFLLFIFWPPAPVVVANLLLVQTWSMELATALSMNGVAWSISVEVFFYLMLPLVIRTRRYFALWLLGAAAIVAFGIIMATLSGEVAETVHGASWSTFLHVGPPARFIEFLAGVGTAMVFQRYAKVRLTPFVWTMLELLAVAGVAFVCWPEPVDMVAAQLHFPQPLTSWILTSGSFPVMCLVVLCFAYGGGAISRLLALRPMVFLGEASFALYMVHQLVQVTWIARGWITNSWDLKAVVTIYTQIFAISFLAYLLIERPARKAIVPLADKLIERRRRLARLAA